MGLLGIVVFEPTIRVGNLRTEIVVRHLAAFRHGVRLVFYLFHIAATRRYRRRTEQEGGFDG